MRDKSFLAMVVDIVQELKQQNSQLVYGRCWAVTCWGGVTWGPVHARSASPLLGILTSRSTSQPVSAEPARSPEKCEPSELRGQNHLPTNLASAWGERIVNKLHRCPLPRLGCQSLPLGVCGVDTQGGPMTEWETADPEYMRMEAMLSQAFRCRQSLTNILCKALCSPVAAFADKMPFVSPAVCDPVMGDKWDGEGSMVSNFMHVEM